MQAFQLLKSILLINSDLQKQLLDNSLHSMIPVVEKEGQGVKVTCVESRPTYLHL